MLAILENCTDYVNQNMKPVPAIQVSATGKKRKSIWFDHLGKVANIKVL